MVDNYTKDHLRICFVHTPMSTVNVPARNMFWSRFDQRYYAVHPNLTPTDASIWELPHWIPWLAGVLRAEGYSKLDTLALYPAVEMSAGIDEDFVRSDLRAHPADVYLFSPMTPNLHLAYAIAKLTKEVYPHAVIVFGGVVATPMHEEVAANPYVDYVVTGRGEYALPALLEAIQGKVAVASIGNLTYKDGNRITVSKKTYPFMPVENIGFPYYDIFPKSVGPQLRYIRQNYALGCPFRCSFCTIQTIGRTPSYFPIERVLAEIRAYRSHYGKHHNIYFGDETFTVNSEKTLKICAALKQEGNVTYDIQTRLTSMRNTEVLAALKSSGCQWVEVGIETLVQGSLNIHKQRTSLSQVKETLKVARDIGLPVCSFMVNGLPDQTLDDMKRSIDAVCSLLSDQLLHASYFFGVVPYPGSLMHHSPEQYGMKSRTNNLALYNEDLEPVYDTAHATSEEIYEVFLRGVEQIGEAMADKPYLGRALDESTVKMCGLSLTHV